MYNFRLNMCWSSASSVLLRIFTTHAMIVVSFSRSRERWTSSLAWSAVLKNVFTLASPSINVSDSPDRISLTRPLVIKRYWVNSSIKGWSEKRSSKVLVYEWKQRMSKCHRYCSFSLAPNRGWKTPGIRIEYTQSNSELFMHYTMYTIILPKIVW